MEQVARIRWEEEEEEEEQRRSSLALALIRVYLAGGVCWLCEGLCQDRGFLGPKVKPRQGLMVAVAVEVIGLD